MILRHIFRGQLRRLFATRVPTFFNLFPKSFPHGGPPKDLFVVNLRQLRREYRGLQSEHHPDIVIGSSELSKDSETSESDDTSALINKAYTTLRNPYTRIAYVIQLQHPQHLDITQDEVSKAEISRLQENSPDYSQDYKMLLMTVLDAHESLELAESDEDLEHLTVENDDRITETLEKIEALLTEEPVVWDNVIIEAIRMKYWVNIANGIKEWEPGKPVHLTH